MPKVSAGTESGAVSEYLPSSSPPRVNVTVPSTCPCSTGAATSRARSTFCAISLSRPFSIRIGSASGILGVIRSVTPFITPTSGISEGSIFGVTVE